MSGLIKREDIDAVRERVRIEDVVSAQVTLKTAGVGSLKGLCPFHDERTPSFTVRPGVGRFHCFGCGESGDAFAFLMKLDGLSFTEAVDGATVPLRMSSQAPCKACSGTGDKNGTPRVCPTCVGTGQVSRGGGGGFSLTDPCVDCK
ncbi:MAG: CHC2 zinc finger domain-containing protein, partial [Promicromonosporaceae bacterium]|nr:CHC2 zinc finger domain-containing protein [Promicromonosporaceae bacterium]